MLGVINAERKRSEVNQSETEDCKYINVHFKFLKTIKKTFYMTI